MPLFPYLQLTDAFVFVAPRTLPLISSLFFILYSFFFLLYSLFYSLSFVKLFY